MSNGKLVFLLGGRNWEVPYENLTSHQVCVSPSRGDGFIGLLVNNTIYGVFSVRAGCLCLTHPKKGRVQAVIYDGQRQIRRRDIDEGAAEVWCPLGKAVLIRASSGWAVIGSAGLRMYPHNGSVVITT